MLRWFTCHSRHRRNHNVVLAAGFHVVAAIIGHLALRRWGGCVGCVLRNTRFRFFSRRRGDSRCGCYNCATLAWAPSQCSLFFFYLIYFVVVYRFTTKQTCDRRLVFNDCCWHLRWWWLLVYRKRCFRRSSSIWPVIRLWGEEEEERKKKSCFNAMWRLWKRMGNHSREKKRTVKSLAEKKKPVGTDSGMVMVGSRCDSRFSAVAFWCFSLQSKRYTVVISSNLLFCSDFMISINVTDYNVRFFFCAHDGCGNNKTTTITKKKHLLL